MNFKKLLSVGLVIAILLLPNVALALDANFTSPGLESLNAFFSPWSVSPEDGIIVGSKTPQTSIVLDTEDLSSINQFDVGNSLGWDGNNLFAPPLIDHDENGNPIIIHGHLYNGRNQDIRIACVGGACGTLPAFGAFDLEGNNLWVARPMGAELIFSSAVTSYEENGEKFYVTAGNADNNGDRLRVMKFSDTGEILWIAGAGLTPGFFDAERHDSAAPAVADVNNDGVLEILVSSISNTYVLDGDGNVLTRFREGGYSTPKSDGQRIYAKNEFGDVGVYQYNPADGTYPQVAHTDYVPPQGSSDEFTFCDIDNDGVNEIAIVGRNNPPGAEHLLRVFDDDGTQMFATVYANTPSHTPPICVDVDGDNELEIATASQDGYVRGFEANGEMSFELHLTMDEAGNVLKNQEEGIDLAIKGLVSSPLPTPDDALHLIITGANRANPAIPAFVVTHELPYTAVRKACLTLGCNNQRNGQLVEFVAEELPEPPSNVSFDRFASSGFESISNVAIGVSLDAPSVNPISLSVAVDFDDASSASFDDFELLTPILQFEPGETQQTVNLRIVSDNLSEINENIFLNLSVLEGNALMSERSSFIYTIFDDDVVEPEPEIRSLEWRFYKKVLGLNDIHISEQDGEGIAAGDSVYKVDSKGDFLNIPAPIRTFFYKMFPKPTYSFNSVYTAADGYKWAVGDNGKFVLAARDVIKNDFTRYYYLLEPLKYFLVINFPSKLNLNAIFFTDNKHAWVAADQGSIFYSTNGGAKWNKANSPLTNSNLNDLKLNTDKFGVAVGDKNLIETTEDGVNWSLLENNRVFENIDLNALDYVETNDPSKLTFVAVGDSASFVRIIKDGMKLYTKQFNLPLFSEYNLNDVDFIGQMGVAVGDNGLILHSKDGGNTWERQETDTDEDFLSVSMTSTKKGYAVTNNAVYSYSY